jgi:hypothetical protein
MDGSNFAEKLFSYMRHLISIILFVSPFLLSAQTTLYVSTTGSDASGNGTASNPYATIAKAAQVANNPSAPVTILVEGGTYRNPNFTTTATLDEVLDYAPQTVGERIWKQTTPEVVRLNGINGTPTAWITIKPNGGQTVILEGDSDNAVTLRDCEYIKFEGFIIKGIADKIPKNLAWKYWGTYRYQSGANLIYGDRKEDVCAEYNRVVFA